MISLQVEACEGAITIILAGRALSVKMLIIIKLDGIFGSNCVYLCILALYNPWYKKGDESSLSIFLAGRAMLITLKGTGSFRP